MDLLYTVDELAENLGISVKAVRNKLSLLKVKKTRTLNRKSLFSGDTIIILNNSYVNRSKPKIEYEIYESKINTIKKIYSEFKPKLYNSKEYNVICESKIKKLYSAFKPPIYNCGECNKKYSQEKTAFRCCSDSAEINMETIVAIQRKPKQTPEEKKIANKLYYKNNREKILLKQRCYDRKKKKEN